MKPIAIIAILILITFYGCKKDKPTPPPQTTQSEDSSQNNNVSAPVRDYMFIPMKDVRWKVHCQGSIMHKQIYDGSYLKYYDTNWHFYADVTSTEIDTIMEGKTYHKFVAEMSQVYKTTIEESLVYIFLREDTLEKKVYTATLHVPLPTGSTSSTSPLPLLNFDVQNVGKGILHSNITTHDSLLIDNVYVERWNGIAWKTKQYCFIQAYGIGSQLGIMADRYYITGNGAQVKSLDFTYKTENFRFDFDVNPKPPM